MVGRLRQDVAVDLDCLRGVLEVPPPELSDSEAKLDASVVFARKLGLTLEHLKEIAPLSGIGEQAIEMAKEPHEHKAEAGFGFVGGPQRGL